MTVLIIGGGLSGLALAQSLKNASPPIPFLIFERDSSAAFRAQGYRIRISSDGVDSLQRLLSPGLFAAFEATSADIVRSMNGMNALTAEPGMAGVGRPGPPPGGAPGGAPGGGPGGGPGGPPSNLMQGRVYNADRAVLRGLLLQGIEGDVQFSKTFVGYTVSSPREVEAHFADGTTASGTTLIGADGLRSAVRHTLLPALSVFDTEGRAVFGKTPLTPAVRSAVADEFTQGICLASPGVESKVKLFTDGIHFTRREAAAKLGFGQLPTDYIYWVLLMQEDVLEEEERPLRKLLGLSEQESGQLAAKLAETWHEKVRAVLEHQDEKATSTLAFFTVKEDNFTAAWSALRTVQKSTLPVTLLGDAAHPMPPVGGVGANLAFQEAVDLFDALAGVYNGSKRALEEITIYEGKMRERAGDALLRSVAGAGNMFGMNPVEKLKPIAWGS